MQTIGTARTAGSEASPQQTEDGATLCAVLRMGRRTKLLAPTLSAGAIVVLDHPDLDSVAARALIAARPAAVINNAPFISGRYPNRGPALLLAANVPLYERAADTPDLWTILRDGESATLAASTLSGKHGESAALDPFTPATLETRLETARANVGAALSDFAQNTLRYLERPEERALLLDPLSVPETKTVLLRRPVLIVVRGDGYEEDLDQLGLFLREQHPAVIAVDGAADALLARGIRPDIVLGDMDSVSDAALKGGSELIVHAYAHPQTGADLAPGLARIRALHLSAQTFPVAGTSEDAALLLAYERGADLIVAVGTHSHLEDFLDKGRGGMASTFLVRLKVGSRLVDARGVSRLYARRQRVGPMMVCLALCAAFPLVVLLANTPVGQLAWRSAVVWWRLRFG